MELKQYNVTVRRFDPTEASTEVNPQSKQGGDFFVLPVDSPDEEHAISAAMSNCVAFTKKYSFGSVKPVAFTCTSVALR